MAVPAEFGVLPGVASLVALASVPLIALAFWPGYLSRPAPTVDRYTHFHAMTGALWMALLIAQPAAIHAGRYRLHRVIGRTTFVLAPLFVVAGGLLSHHRLVSMDNATFATEGAFHYLPFYATLAFAVAYVLGVRHRHLPAAHARFMLCTAIPLTDPVLGRVLFFYLPPLSSFYFYQVITFGIATAIAGLLVFTYRGEVSARRELRGYFVLLVALELGWFSLARAQAWLHVVGWFRGLG